MEIDEVDIQRMCEETAGYFTPERVERAFNLTPHTPALEEAKRLFCGKTLAGVIDTYSMRTYEMGGDYENAAIRFIARFFPKMFLN